MKCPTCRSENPADNKFCGECGSSLPAESARRHCGQENPTSSSFCDNCGRSLDTIRTRDNTEGLTNRHWRKIAVAAGVLGIILMVGGLNLGTPIGATEMEQLRGGIVLWAGLALTVGAIIGYFRSR